MILVESAAQSSRVAAGVLVVAAGALAGCFQPETGADELEPGETPPVRLFADGGTNPGCPPDESPALTTLGITVRTTPFGGRYQPRNVGAVWIEDADGGFVKTVKVWARTRRRYLEGWLDASGGNVVDAVTGATLSSHVTHQVLWELTDLAGCEVPDGDYQVVMELTDRNGPGALARFPLTKRGDPVTLTPADVATFHDVVLTLQ
jgi:hypothetical protein